MSMCVAWRHDVFDVLVVNTEAINGHSFGDRNSKSVQTYTEEVHTHVR